MQITAEVIIYIGIAVMLGNMLTAWWLWAFSHAMRRQMDEMDWSHIGGMLVPPLMALTAFFAVS